MKTKVFICLFSACATPTSFAAWDWDDGGVEFTLVNNATSGDFSLTPLNADYDLTNDVDGQGFDQAPTPVSFTWDSGSEPISITLDSTGTYFNFNIDPDNDDLLPSSVTFDVLYSNAISDRGIAGGGLFANVNPLSSTLDFQLTVLDAALNQIVLDSSYNFRTSFGAPAPDPSFPGGTALYNDLLNVNAGQNAFPGLTNGGANASTNFPRSSTDPTLAAGGLNLLFSDFSAGEEFRISFDGGVAENALTVVPEPSICLFSSLALLGIFHRRRKP